MNIKILKLEKRLRAGGIILMLALFTIAGVSFTTIKLGDDFLKQLGITNSSVQPPIGYMSITSCLMCIFIKLFQVG